MTKDPALISPEVLETIWAKWHIQQFGEDISQRYFSVHRSGYKAREFESWLLEQGAEVRQINKKRYIRFFNKKDATFFLLRWS